MVGQIDLCLGRGCGEVMLYDGNDDNDDDNDRGQALHEASLI